MKCIIKYTVSFLLFVFLFFLSFVSRADSTTNFNKIVHSIYLAEGGSKTKYPYGIRSVPIKGKTVAERELYARKICFNTVSNNWERWRRAGKTNDFIVFLANKYCPQSVDPVGHTNWIKNVKFFVDKKRFND